MFSGYNRRLNTSLATSIIVRIFFITRSFFILSFFVIRILAIIQYLIFLRRASLTLFNFLSIWLYKVNKEALISTVYFAY